VTKMCSFIFKNHLFCEILNSSNKIPVEVGVGCGLAFDSTVGSAVGSTVGSDVGFCAASEVMVTKVRRNMFKNHFWF
jgi:hypothetical protein